MTITKQEKVKIIVKYYFVIVRLLYLRQLI